MTHTSYITIRTDVGDSNNRPIEAVGYSNLEGVSKLPQEPSRSYIAIPEGTPISREQAGDEFMIEFYDAEAESINRRPDLPEIQFTEITDFAAYPDECVILVRNEAGEELQLTTPTTPLELTDPGTYSFEIQPPFPWLPLNKEITVA